MSIPGWNEQSPFGRQRDPNGLAIGPWTGQISPDDDGAGAGVGLLGAAEDEPDDVLVGGAARAAAARAAAARAAAAAWAARMRAASAALWLASCCDSFTSSCS